MKRKRKVAKRRNVFAASLSRFARQIEPSSKLYKRKAKHRKAPDHSSGGFSYGGLSSWRYRQVSRACT
jgi:hypothetical protein